MKFIPHRKVGNLTTKGVLRQLMENQPGPDQGISYQELFARGRVLDRLEKHEAGIMLEDADHELVKSIIERFVFTTAITDLRDILRDIIEAKEPPAAMLLQPPSQPQHAA